MTADLEHKEFTRHLNAKFRIHLNEAETMEAELTDVSEHLVSPRQERFSLIFRTPNEPFLGQGLRQFDHDEMGSFNLFVVPVGRDDRGTSYEAVFNRLINK